MIIISIRNFNEMIKDGIKWMFSYLNDDVVNSSEINNFTLIEGVKGLDF